MAKIRVTKLEAAQRQIDAAIRLLFNDEDPIAIHSVAAAGCRIVRDSAKKSDTEVWKMMGQCIRPEMQKKFNDEVMNKFANFLKHADRDPDQILDEVDETINDIEIFLACILHNDLGLQWSPEMRIFVSWYSGIYPDHIRDDFPWSSLLKEIAKNWQDLPRREQLAFGKMMLDLSRR